MKRLILFAAAFALCICTSVFAAETKHTFAIGDDAFLLDGKPFQIRCGELHAPRVPVEYWSHRLKMFKAMGLNAVCAYMFWNMHEPFPGQFNFEGEADVAAFCRAAQKEGLWVLLRPGPYACAEWEFGGLPWWLLKEKNIKLRSTDPKFLIPAKRYLREVTRRLKHLQVTEGGPILMVQVENEYGFWGKEKAYLPELRKVMQEEGFKVPLFACNPAGCLKNGADPELFAVANFGANPKGEFKRLRAFQPKGPLMCGEFYPAWFDSWGSRHHKKPPAKMMKTLQEMCEMKASFSIYMAHGGTTFGFWSGCNAPFQPQTSSYDYDAPVSEAGWVTEKFNLVRELFSKHLNPGEKLGEIPAANPVIEFSMKAVASSASIFDNLPPPVVSERPKTMEQLDCPYGVVLYRSKIPAGVFGTLNGRIRDMAVVRIDGKPAGYLDCRKASRGIKIVPSDKERTVDILVEPMGRYNFGTIMHQAHKGIVGSVKVGDVEILNWQQYRLALDNAMLSKIKWGPAKDISTSSAISDGTFRRFEVKIDKPGDTFLNVLGLKKGAAWVNGHNLGRYWGIGPTQTMYVPGCWLKPGINEFIIWESAGSNWKDRPFSSMKTPMLDTIDRDMDFSKVVREPKTVKLDKPVKVGQFTKGKDPQDIMFDKPVKGRYFAIKATSTWDGGNSNTSIAELDLLDKDGKPISKARWGIAAVDSEEVNADDNCAENAIDGQIVAFWHSAWSSNRTPLPHYLALDLGESIDVYGIRYVARQDMEKGRIKGYELFVSDDLVK